MSEIRVFLVDDHPVVRQGLQQLLKEQSGIEFVGEASDGREALKKIPLARPDVVLLDLAMPRMSGFEAIGAILHSRPEARVVVFSMHDKEEYVHRVLAEGARGYLLKGAPGAEVVEAIRKVYAGDYFLSSKIKKSVIQLYIQSRDKVVPSEPYDLLSEREQQVFRLLVEGHSTHRVAEMLYISPKTVEKHRVNLMKKLELPDVISMVKYALRIGIIDPDFWKN